jgi:transposase
MALRRAAGCLLNTSLPSPRDEKVYPPPADACHSCGGGLRHLGEDMAEQLEYIQLLRRDCPSAGAKSSDRTWPGRP